MKKYFISILLVFPFLCNAQYDTIYNKACFKYPLGLDSAKHVGGQISHLSLVNGIICSDTVASGGGTNIYNSSGTIPSNTNRTVTVPIGSTLGFVGNIAFKNGYFNLDTLGHFRVVYKRPLENDSFGLEIIDNTVNSEDPTDSMAPGASLYHQGQGFSSRINMRDNRIQGNSKATISIYSQTDSGGFHAMAFDPDSIGGIVMYSQSPYLTPNTRLLLQPTACSLQGNFNVTSGSISILDDGGNKLSGLLGSTSGVQYFDNNGGFISSLGIVANSDGSIMAYVDSFHNNYITHYPKYLTGNYHDSISMGSGYRVLDIDGQHADSTGHVNVSRWGLTGNAGTSYPTNMIGASDGAVNVVGSIYTTNQVAAFVSTGIGGTGIVTVNDSINNCNIVVGCGFADSGFAILSSDLVRSSDSIVGITGNWKTNNIRFEFIGPAYYNLPKTSPTLGQIAVADASNNLTWQKVPNLPHTIFTPTTGATITAIDNQMNIVNPAAPILALTINLPATPADNDRVEIKFDQAVSNVTYGGGTVLGGLVSPIIGSVEILTYDSGTSTWY